MIARSLPRPRPARLPRAPLPAGLVVALALSAGCGDDGGGPGGAVRVVHLAPEHGGLEVLLVDGDGGASAVPLDPIVFREVTPFLSVPAGLWRVEVRPVGGDGPPALVLDGLPVVEGGSQTVVLSEQALDGAAEDVAAFVVGDATPAPEPGRAAVRFVHAGVGLPDVRLYLDGALLGAGVPYRGEVLATDLSGGSFTLGVDYRDEPESDAAGDVLALGAGARVTGFLVRRPGPQPGVFALELALFDRREALGTVPLQ